MNKGGRTRWVICGLLFALVALSYIDRLIIGIFSGTYALSLLFLQVLVPRIGILNQKPLNQSPPSFAPSLSAPAAK